MRAFVLELARSAGLEPVPEVAIGKQQIGPACVGFAKPQILLPENWPRGLSPAAERNALWHELAHVARRDGWLMLGQRVAEAFLAFHPAAWWVSRQLELERESACDDWAAARAGVDVVEYGESLLECVELLVGLPKRATENYLVAGWIRSPSQLKRRLFNMTNSQRGHHATVHPLAIGLLAATFCIAALGTASAWPVLPGTLANSGSGAVVSGAVEEWNDERLSADDSPLFSAVRSGDPEIVRALLDAGQSANQIWPGDGSPLIVAARQGDREMVQLLIDEGADVDLGVGGDGTPLIQAAAHGYRDIVDLLLSHGANVDAHGRGGDGNPIIQASLNGKRDLVKYLAERGAAIDIHIKNDDTPLINAAQQGHVGVVKLLLELGADPNLEGDFDRELGKVRTPLNQARANGHNNVARLLQSSGANG